MCDSNGIQGWNEDFFKQIGLTDLVDKRFTQIGRQHIRLLILTIRAGSARAVSGYRDQFN